MPVSVLHAHPSCDWHHERLPRILWYQPALPYVELAAHEVPWELVEHLASLYGAAGDEMNASPRVVRSRAIRPEQYIWHRSSPRN